MEVFYICECLAASLLPRVILIYLAPTAATVERAETRSAPPGVAQARVALAVAGVQAGTGG